MNYLTFLQKWWKQVGMVYRTTEKLLQIKAAYNEAQGLHVKFE